MARTKNSGNHRKRIAALLLALLGTLMPPSRAGQARAPSRAVKPFPKPKLVVLLVVDQMRADYVDKFRLAWTGGLKRLVDEGAWFRNAAYPYAATETCVGHATISTGALPTTHGMISNEWWDRGLGKSVTCTADPNVKNVGYAGATVIGGDSAVKMLLPAFADELKFQWGGGSRVVTFSLKARASITMGGRTADAVTWFDPSVGAWTTSTAFPAAPFVEEYAKAHPVSGDYGKTWAPLLPSSSYLYAQAAFGADHGVVPIPDDLVKSGREAGWLNLAGVQAHIETALEPFHFPKPIISEISATDVYFAPGVYDKLKSDPAALDAVLKAIEAVPGVFAVYRGEELEDSPATRSPLRTAQANSFFPARSGDLLLVPKPYWPWDSSAPGAIRTYGTTHGSPYAYDQRVPVLFMGYGIQPGEYFESATPADIAPTLAALCGVTLAPLEGHILYEALKKREPAAKSSKAARASSTPH